MPSTVCVALSVETTFSYNTLRLPDLVRGASPLLRKRSCAAANHLSMYLVGALPVRITRGMMNDYRRLNGSYT